MEDVNAITLSTLSSEYSSDDSSSASSPSSRARLKSGSNQFDANESSRSRHSGSKSNNTKARPRDSTGPPRKAEAQPLATQLWQARVTQTQFAADLEFENKIRRLCWTSHIPRAVADKVIEAFRETQEAKKRIETYGVQQIIQELGHIDHQLSKTRDLVPSNANEPFDYLDSGDRPHSPSILQEKNPGLRSSTPYARPTVEVASDQSLIRRGSQ